MTFQVQGCKGGSGDADAGNKKDGGVIQRTHLISHTARRPRPGVERRACVWGVGVGVGVSVGPGGTPTDEVRAVKGVPMLAAWLVGSMADCPAGPTAA